MIITVKTTRNFIVVIGLMVFILAGSLSWAEDIVFTDYSARDLKVLEVNVEAQTVVFESPDEDTAVLTVGDIVGQEYATIIEIREIMIVLQQPPDDTGRAPKICIPVIRIGSPVPLGTQ